MFARISTLFVFALPLLAVASVVPRQDATETGETVETPDSGDTTTTTTSANISQCNTGPVQCCNSVQSASELDPDFLGSYDLSKEKMDKDTMIGLTCTESKTACTGTSKAVCCSNNGFNGAIAIGCNPIDIDTVNIYF